MLMPHRATIVIQEFEIEICLEMFSHLDFALIEILKCMKRDTQLNTSKIEFVKLENIQTDWLSIGKSNDLFVFAYDLTLEILSYSKIISVSFLSKRAIRFRIAFSHPLESLKINP